MNFAEHNLSSDLLGACRVFIPEGWPENFGFGIKVGDAARSSAPYVRIHSRCAYGDVFGSTNCDCRGQLVASCNLLREHGGILFYLEQEGRGAGINVKARAYQEHERTAIDTFAYYESLGLAADLRSFDLVAQTLVRMGFGKIRLISNNPKKIEAIERVGLEVERVVVTIEASEEVSGYLGAKHARGHLIG